MDSEVFLLIVRHVLGRRAELGVRLDHLVHRLQKVLLSRHLATGANGEHAFKILLFVNFVYNNRTSFSTH